MKKVLIATIDFPPICGGVANYLAGLAENLPKDKVVVLAPSAENTEEKQYKIYRKKLITDVFFLWPKWLPLVYHLFKIIKKGLKNLSASPQKTILKICQGSLFNFSEKELEKKKFTVQRVQIRGETNDKAENLFHKILKDKFNITTKDPKDYKGENLRQFAILKKRRDFKNVKRFVNGVEKIIQSSP